MKPRTFQPIPDLDAAIATHAGAVLRGEHAAAEAMVAPQALEAHRAVLRIAPVGARYELLARAKIGFQYIAKVRWSGEGSDLIVQNRWSQQDGRWMIVEVDDLRQKRSPWSDIGRNRAAGEARNA